MQPKSLTSADTKTTAENDVVCAENAKLIKILGTQIKQKDNQIGWYVEECKKLRATHALELKMREKKYNIKLCAEEQKFVNASSDLLKILTPTAVLNKVQLQLKTNNLTDIHFQAVKEAHECILVVEEFGRMFKVMRPSNMYIGQYSNVVRLKLLQKMIRTYSKSQPSDITHCVSNDKEPVQEKEQKQENINFDKVCGVKRKWDQIFSMDLPENDLFYDSTSNGMMNEDRQQNTCKLKDSIAMISIDSIANVNERTSLSTMITPVNDELQIQNNANRVQRMNGLDLLLKAAIELEGK